MRRYIITGAPGAGKTVLLAGLCERGYAVVGEAATDVIAREQARGHDEAWREPGFLDAITALQRERRQRPVPPGTAVQVFDRSPICTLALARYGEQPVTPLLAAEIEQVTRERIYEPRVFFVHLLGFITPTAARRITLEQSLRFEGLHVRAYREHGFELVDVPAAPVGDRVELVDGLLRAWSG